MKGPLERLGLSHGTRVALDWILEIVPPVQLDGTGDVPLLVEIGILVHFGDDDPGIPCVLGEPIRRHEHGLRIAVLRHSALLKLSLLKRAYQSSPGVRMIFHNM